MVTIELLGVLTLVTKHKFLIKYVGNNAFWLELFKIHHAFPEI